MSQPIPLDDFEFFRDDWNRIDHAADPLRVIDPQPVTSGTTGPSVVSTVRQLPAAWAPTPKRSAPRTGWRTRCPSSRNPSTATSPRGEPPGSCSGGRRPGFLTRNNSWPS